MAKMQEVLHLLHRVKPSLLEQLIQTYKDGQQVEGIEDLDNEFVKFALKTIATSECLRGEIRAARGLLPKTQRASDVLNNLTQLQVEGVDDVSMDGEFRARIEDKKTFLSQEMGLWSVPDIEVPREKFNTEDKKKSVSMRNDLFDRNADCVSRAERWDYELVVAENYVAKRLKSYFKEYQEATKVETHLEAVGTHSGCPATVVVGRVLSDASEIKTGLRPMELLLQGVGNRGRPAVVEFRVDHCKRMYMYPGKLVVVRGTSGQPRPKESLQAFHAIEIQDPFPIPFPETPLTMREPIAGGTKELTVIGGPFHLANALIIDFQRVKSILEKVMKDPPRELVIIGPFLEQSCTISQEIERRGLFATGKGYSRKEPAHIAICYLKIFELLADAKMKMKNTIVSVVPHRSDLLAPFCCPQPPFDATALALMAGVDLPISISNSLIFRPNPYRPHVGQAISVGGSVSAGICIFGGNPYKQLLPPRAGGLAHDRGIKVKFDVITSETWVARSLLPCSTDAYRVDGVPTDPIRLSALQEGDEGPILGYGVMELNPVTDRIFIASLGRPLTKKPKVLSGGRLLLCNAREVLLDISSKGDMRSVKAIS